jgi:NodT family efflux transporter outer membrane factor (OMF) lipoprotein
MKLAAMSKRHRATRKVSPSVAAVTAATWVAIGLFCLSVAACAVGPGYKRPAVPAAGSYAPESMPAQTAAAPDVAGGEAQHFSEAQDVSWQWWTLYQSAALNKLVEQAFANNPTILNAQAVLKQAQELVAAQRGFFYPTLGAGYSFERQKVAGNLANSVAPGVQGNGTDIVAYQNPNAAPHNAPLYYNFHTAQLTVGYTPDVFGSNWREVESLHAQAEAQRYALEAAYMTLASNIVAAVVQEAMLRDQLDAVHAMVDENSRGLDILLRQFQDGYVMRADVAAQEAQLAQARALVPPLEKQLAQTRDLLRALVGRMPDQDVAATFKLADLRLPQELPLSVPSKIIDQRPDVRAAEELLHSANAELGVAIAARFPQFPITGAYGGTATEFSQMFASGGPFWNIILGVTQPLFEGGTLLHRQRAAQQALIQAATQYQLTVLSAYQNIADTLHAIYSDADGLLAVQQYERAARVQLDIARRQREAGLTSELFLLQAQEAYQQAAINRIQLQSQRFGDTAALFVALGGGWWNRTAQE